jgi:hypothetical protein
MPWQTALARTGNPWRVALLLTLCNWPDLGEASGADIGCISIKTLAAQIRVVCAPRAGSDKAIACNWGRLVRAGDQGVQQGADVRVSRSDPGFEIYAGLPLACRMASDEFQLPQ